MPNGNNPYYGQIYTDKTLIESILASHFIVDYGYIKNVNPDETVDVTHAKQLKTLGGDSLSATVTKKVEVLTICGGGFSLKFDYKKGDKVLLLGLKDYVPKVEDVTGATETTTFLHYTRETLKAIPMCVFNGDAKVKIEIKEGTLTIDCQQDVNITAGGNVNVEAKGNATVKSPNTKLTGGIVEIGGTVAPTGSGALCGIPACAFSGAPHVGNQSSGA